MSGQACRPKRAVRAELLADLPISRTPCEKIRNSRRRHRWDEDPKRYRTRALATAVFRSGLERFASTLARALCHHRREAVHEARLPADGQTDVSFCLDDEQIFTERHLH